MLTSFAAHLPQIFFFYFTFLLFYKATILFDSYKAHFLTTQRDEIEKLIISSFCNFLDFEENCLKKDATSILKKIGEILKFIFQQTNCCLYCSCIYEVCAIRILHNKSSNCGFVNSWFTINEGYIHVLDFKNYNVI